ncbi:hypothetical protein ACTXQV_64615, partial [Klebsiella pneumoniae]
LPQIQRRLGAIVWRVERAAGAILMLLSKTRVVSMKMIMRINPPYLRQTG